MARVKRSRKEARQNTKMSVLAKKNPGLFKGPRVAEEKVIKNPAGPGRPVTLDDFWDPELDDPRMLGATSVPRALKDKRYYEAHKDDPERKQKRAEYMRNYRARKAAEKEEM